MPWSRSATGHCCLVLLASAVLLTGCNEECDHPLDPGGGWSTLESIDIYTQAELEDLRGVESVGGRLTIAAYCDTCVINDLSPLADLTTVGGLTIANTHLRNLTGLENLTHVQYGLSILNNDSLANIDALASMETVGSLWLEANPRLASLAPLGAVTGVERIAVSDLEMLETLDVFEDLDDLTSLGVRHCSQLHSLPDLPLPVLDDLYLAGLSALPTVALGADELPVLRGLRLEGLPLVEGLGELPGMPALQSLQLRELLALGSLPSLAGYTSLRDLSLISLPGITDLASLDAATINSLGIDRMHGLTDLGGPLTLPALDALYVSRCENLASLAGLTAAPVLQRLILEDCGRLTDAGGTTFDSLETMLVVRCGFVDLSSFGSQPACRYVELSGCNDLTSIEGVGAFDALEELDVRMLPNLSTLGEGTSLAELTILRFSWCQDLTSLSGLASLPSLRVFDVDNCDALENLAGPTYPTVLNSVSLTYNEDLNSLEGFGWIESIEYLTIMGNPSLSDAAAFAFAQNIEITGYARIGGNDP